ncbi:hypothetical protein I6N98_08780 [Spongiibacter nanhainus]|uniref:Uncharacterized protein n=1 Tax=Spongiibacter nanhainus TaxID=2794344 RepID=A0A7T4R447_9GAMM|nr:hypothetical protein [Spongiibacter nanhainus]QQD19909.1 hypothetical protein I6N98_08780 [Spongiibacter nanhainus]
MSVFQEQSPRFRHHMRIIGLNVAAVLNAIFSFSLLVVAMTASAQSSSSQGDEEQPLPVVKLSPAVRSEVIDPYAELPCRKLGTVSPDTEVQREALKRRSKACLKAHEAFLPSATAPGPR